MIEVEGREFTLAQHREAVAFLEGILLDLDRLSIIIVENLIII